MDRIVVASRTSRLAVAQWQGIKTMLEKARPTLRVVLEPAGAAADDDDEAMRAMLERVRSGRAHAAVCPLKLLPADSGDGLAIVATPRREDPRDVFLSRDGRPLERVRRHAAVGVSDARRRAFLLAARPDLRLVPVHGPIDERVRRLLSREFDGVVLARADLTALAFPDLAVDVLDPAVCLPAPSQGALALLAREADEAVARALQPLDDPATAICATSERAFARRLGARAAGRVGALARFDGSMLELDGAVVAADGGRIMRSTLIGDPTDANGIGIRLAQTLLALGAEDLLGGDGA